MRKKNKTFFDLYLACTATAVSTVCFLFVIYHFWLSAYGQNLPVFPSFFGLFITSAFLGALSLKTIKPNAIIPWLTLVWSGGAIAFLKLGIALSPSALLMAVLIIIPAGFGLGITLTSYLKLIPKEKTLHLCFYSSASLVLGSLLAVLWLIPTIGHLKTTLIIATLGLGTIYIGKSLRPPVFAAFLLPLCFWAYPLVQIVNPQATLSSPHKRGRSIVYQKQSGFHKIVLAEDKTSTDSISDLIQHTLYTNGLTRFQSNIEQSNHTCLTNIPLEAARFFDHRLRNAVVFGEGHGLIARNLFIVPHIRKIYVIQQDKDLISLAQKEQKVRMYNLDSLINKKVTIVHEEPFSWVRQAEKTTPKKQFDLMVIAFPPPRNTVTARYYTAEFFSQIRKLLTPHGMVVIQAGPTFETMGKENPQLSKTVSCIKKTLSRIGIKSFVYENSTSHHAFILYGADPSMDIPKYFKHARMLSSSSHPQLCQHNPKWKTSEVQANTFSQLWLPRYYRDFSTKPLLTYRGPNSILLPD